MEFSIIRKEGGLVRPYKQTPIETLDLSVIDELPALRCNARTLHVFTHGPEAARVIREALSKALVHYYPLAGRLKEPSHSHARPQVECCGQGVLLVEASASCTLNSVNYFDNVESIPYHDVLPVYVPRNEDTEPLVQMQVTQFECGGFVIGLIFCHTICDGLGAAQFLNAVGELARGVEHPSISPVWCRNFSPLQPPHQQANFTAQPIPLPPIMPNYKLEHANIDIPMDGISQLKKEFHESTGQTCSTFEVVAATFWRQRTIAIKMQSETEMKLVFFANGRQALDTPLPQGFYGNCFFPVTITASAESLAQSSNTEVIKLIQETKAKLPIEFNKYLKGEYLKDGEDPFAPPLVYTTLFISEWGRLGFNQVDYGWGPPAHIVPIQGSAIIPVGIVGSLPLPKKGIRLMTWCVEQLHRPQFLQLMMNATSIF